MNEQAGSVEEKSAIFEELTATINEVAKTSNDTKKLTLKAKGSGFIIQSAENINTRTQKNTESADKILACKQSLQEEVIQLTGLISQFKINI